MSTHEPCSSFVKSADESLIFGDLCQNCCYPPSRHQAHQTGLIVKQLKSAVANLPAAKRACLEMEMIKLSVSVQVEAEGYGKKARDRRWEPKIVRLITPTNDELMRAVFDKLSQEGEQTSFADECESATSGVKQLLSLALQEIKTPALKSAIELYLRDEAEVL